MHLSVSSKSTVSERKVRSFEFLGLHPKSRCSMSRAVLPPIRWLDSLRERGGFFGGLTTKSPGLKFSTLQELIKSHAPVSTAYIVYESIIRNVFGSVHDGPFQKHDPASCLPKVLAFLDGKVAFT